MINYCVFFFFIFWNRDWQLFHFSKLWPPSILVKAINREQWCQSKVTKTQHLLFWASIDGYAVIYCLVHLLIHPKALSIPLFIRHSLGIYSKSRGLLKTLTWHLYFDEIAHNYKWNSLTFIRVLFHLLSSIETTCTTATPWIYFNESHWKYFFCL